MICALSGGVDSTVAATLVHKVLGDRLHCVFVDNGLLRYKVRRGLCLGICRILCVSGTLFDTFGVHLAPCRWLPPPVLATQLHIILRDGTIMRVPSFVKVQVTACQPSGLDHCRRQSV